MRRIVISGLNGALLLLTTLVLGAAAWYWMSAQPLVQPNIIAQPQAPPTNTYNQINLEYEKLGKPSLSLDFKVPTMSVPDLRQILKYHGTNQRPDSDAGRSLFFSLGERGGELMSVLPNTRQYLIRQEGNPANFSPSPKNQPTDLWFEVKPQGVSALISVSLKEPGGQILNDPKERTVFSLPEKPLAPQEKMWQIADFRVDGTLLARQKAKWSGRDLFLEDHGGAPYAQAQGKQRISFGEKEKQYAIFVSQGDLIVWKEGKWHPVSLNEATKGLPLMRVDKVDERLISMTLFSADGASKVQLNLLKVPDPIPQEAIIKNFQFVGARTRVHFMFKIQGKRDVVGVDDWYLLNSGAWKKLKTHEEVDEYVAGKLQGPLLVLRGIDKNQDVKILLGTLYSSNRSATQEIQIPLTIEIKKIVPKPAPKPVPPPEEIPQIPDDELEEH